MRPFVSLAATVAIVAMGVACNSLLGNEMGKYREDRDGSALGPSSSSSSTSSGAGDEAPDDGSTGNDTGSDGSSGGPVLVTCASAAPCTVLDGVPPGALDLAVTNVMLYWAEPGTSTGVSPLIRWRPLVGGAPDPADETVQPFRLLGGLVSTRTDEPSVYLLGALGMDDPVLNEVSGDRFVPIDLAVPPTPDKVVAALDGIAWTTDTGIGTYVRNVYQLSAPASLDLAGNSTHLFAITDGMDEVQVLGFPTGIITLDRYQALGTKLAAASETHLYLYGPRGFSICATPLPLPTSEKALPLADVAPVGGTVDSMYYARDRLYWTVRDEAATFAVYRCAQPGACVPQLVATRRALAYSHNLYGDYVLTSGGALFLPHATTQ